MKVLIAEDDQLLSSIIATTFRTAGVEVMCAFDGEATIAHLQASKPDVILLDILMPKENGFAVLEWLKKTPELSSIPVIVLSNVGEAGEVEKAKQYGVTDYLVKANTTPIMILERVKNLHV